MTNMTMEYPFVIDTVIFKSSLRRAKCEIETLYGWDEPDNQVGAEEIYFEKIVSHISKVVSHYKHWGTSGLNIKLVLRAVRRQNYKTINGRCDKREPVNFYVERKDYSSIESYINTLLDLIILANPNLHLSHRELHENPSIKYWIKVWYNT